MHHSPQIYFFNLSAGGFFCAWSAGMWSAGRVRNLLSSPMRLWCGKPRNRTLGIGFDWHHESRWAYPRNLGGWVRTSVRISLGNATHRQAALGIAYQFDTPHTIKKSSNWPAFSYPVAAFVLRCCLAFSSGPSRREFVFLAQPYPPSGFDFSVSSLLASVLLSTHSPLSTIHLSSALR